jgi:membrane protease subunit (stomatin/prohibitin family)
MGFFSSKKEGGMMDMIRCDEQEYLVWKWRPSGNDVNSTNKENAIRWGSSLRVKEGELAVFVYKKEDGGNHDFILGPHDEIIKTANFPVLASIIGLGFGGGTPFQAEIYFINLSGNVQLRFGVPYFDVFDPRFLDFPVPMSARGTITFNITNYKEFIKLNRLINFELEDLNKQIKDAVTKYVKGVITNIPSEKGIPVLQIERKILEISDIIAAYLKPRLENDFGINLKAFDLAAIEVDKEGAGYAELRTMTADQTMKTTIAQTDVNIKNLEDLQAINVQNMEESLRIQREEAQRAQKLQTETNFIGTHALNQQSEVLKAAADSLGNMGSMNLGDGGMNTAGMMTGMMMGGAVGNQMANMMNNMGNMMNNPNAQQPSSNQMPPPPPAIQYFVSINGQQTGPFNMQQLQQMVTSGQLQRNTFVWKQGMQNWEEASKLLDLQNIFGAVPPPPPPMP